MPQQPSPPYLFAALQYPRQLWQWDDLNYQNGKLQRTKTTITLPPFSTNVTWNGYSDIVTSFNFEAPNNFALDKFAPIANTQYVLCISYVKSGVMNRYMLWNAVGSNMSQVIPQYNGQLILKNFRLEVWSTSQGNIVEQNGITIQTSVAGQYDYRYGYDGPLANNDGQNTNFACNQLYTVPQVIAIQSAGDSFLNQLYYLDVQFIDVTGHPRYISADGNYRVQWLNTGSPSFINQWEIATINSLRTAYYWFSKQATDPTQVSTWFDNLGTAPPPSVTDATYIQPDTGYYSLPLTFPSTSVSTPN